MIRLGLAILAATGLAVAEEDYINPDMLTCDETMCREYFGGDQWVTRDPREVCRQYPGWPNCDKLTAGSKIPQACRDATKLEGIGQTITDGLKCIGDLALMLPSPTPAKESPDDSEPGKEAPPPREVRKETPPAEDGEGKETTEGPPGKKPDSTGDGDVKEPLLADEKPSRPEPLTPTPPAPPPVETPAAERSPIAFASPDPEPEPGRPEPQREPEPDDSVHGAGPNPLAGVTGSGVVIKRTVEEVMTRLEQQEPGRLRGGLEIRQGPHGTGTAGESGEEKVRQAFLEWQDRANRLLNDPKASPEDLAGSLKELSRLAAAALGSEANPLRASIDRLIRAAESGEGLGRGAGGTLPPAEDAGGRGVASLPFLSESEPEGDVILTDREEIRRVTGGTGAAGGGEPETGATAVPALTVSAETGRRDAAAGSSDVTRFLGETSPGSGGAWGRLRQWARLTGRPESADRLTASARGALGPRSAGAHLRGDGLLSSFVGSGGSAAATLAVAAAATGFFLFFLWRRRKRRRGG